MTLNITQGAIMKMCFTSEYLQPVLQVIDLKLVKSQQTNNLERYRLLLSDGSYYQQGMLATQKNKLIHSGRLQKGSIVKLSKYLCNDILNRKIIIVVELDVILDKWDLIGVPVPAPKEAHAQSSVSHAGNVQSAAGQVESTAGNSQYLNGSSAAGGVNARPNVAVPSMERPNVNLTQGAIMTMCFPPEKLQPVLQVIDLKLVQAQQNSTTETYRLVLSDGSYYQQGMLATQKNELVHSGRLQKGSVVKLSQYVQNRK